MIFFLMIINEKKAYDYLFYHNGQEGSLCLSTLNLKQIDEE